MPNERTAEYERFLETIETESGTNLLALTRASPVLLIFLRHFGCSFCRQAISDVADLRGEMQARGVRPVFVHLGTPERARPYFAYYKLEQVERVSNPAGEIYRNPIFALERQHLAWQFVDPRVWYGWVVRGAFRRHGIGKVQEDGEQMPGIFLLRDGGIARSFRYKTIADQPNYRRLMA